MCPRTQKCDQDAFGRFARTQKCVQGRKNATRTLLVVLQGRKKKCVQGRKNASRWNPLISIYSPGVIQCFDSYNYTSQEANAKFSDDL